MAAFRLSSTTRSGTLIEDQLGVQVARVGQHQHKDPGLAQLAGGRVDGPPGIAKVDLGLGARRHLYPHERCRGLVAFQPAHQAPEGAVAERLPVRLLQARPDRGHLDALLPQGQNLVLVGGHRRGLLGWQHHRQGRLQARFELADVRQRARQQLLLGRPAAIAGHRPPIQAHQASDLAVAGAVAQQPHDLVNIHRAGSPIGH